MPDEFQENYYMKIAIAGTGYVGLSLAVLLSQHNQVTAVDIIHEKVELINEKISYYWQGNWGVFKYKKTEHFSYDKWWRSV